MNKMVRLIGECIVVSFNFQCIWHSMCSKFKWHCGALFLSLHIALNALDPNQLMANKGFGKRLHCKRGCSTHSTKEPINETI